jgi:hypothetical protein
MMISPLECLAVLAFIDLVADKSPLSDEGLSRIMKRSFEDVSLSQAL